MVDKMEVPRLQNLWIPWNFQVNYSKNLNALDKENFKRFVAVLFQESPYTKDDGDSVNQEM